MTQLSSEEWRATASGTVTQFRIVNGVREEYDTTINVSATASTRPAARQAALVEWRNVADNVPNFVSLGSRGVTGVNQTSVEEWQAEVTGTVTLHRTTYRATVTATGTLRVTVYHAESTASGRHPNNPPPAPAVSAPTPSATPSNPSLDITWTAATGGSIVTAYDLRYRTGTGSWNILQDVWQTGGGALAYSILGLEPVTRYEIEVRAVRSRIDGVWSSAVFATTLAARPDAPAAPTPGTATTTALPISWTAPDNGGSAITAYDVRHIEATEDDTDDNNWTVVDSAWTTGTLTYTITGLTSGTDYKIQVRAISARGDGPWSPTALGRTVGPGKPTMPAAPTVTAGTDTTSLAVSWTAVSALPTVTAYDVRHILTSADETDDDNWTVVDNAWTSGDLTHTIAGLVAGTSYDVQMRGVNSLGDGTWSAATVATTSVTPPSAPATLTLVPRDVSSITVTWAAPNNNGATITSYDLRYILTSADETDDDNWTVVDSAWTSGDLTYDITGLAAQSYDVQVRGVNAAGDGPWSPTRTGTPVVMPPTAPTALAAAAFNPLVSHSSLALTWGAPSSNGGSAITGYDVRWRVGTGDWTVVDDAWTSGDLAYTLAGLAASTTHEIQVRAVNSTRDGVWSESVTEATPAAVATQAISLGTTPFGDGNAEWTGAVLLDSRLVDGGETAYLRYIRRQGNHIQLRLSATATGEPSDAGPELATEREEADTLLVFSLAGGDSIFLRGPGNSDNTYADSTEPYFWTPDNGRDWNRWVTAAFVDGGVVTLTISLGAVATPNQAPTASAAGTPTTVAGGGTVTLDGTASDPDTGDALTYAWSSDGGGSFADASALDTTWTAPAATSSDQSITLTLTVTDGGGLTTTADVDVTVSATPNQAPTASAAGTPTTVAGGGAVALDGTASDPDTGDTLTYAWSSDGGGSFAASSALDTTWTAPAATSSDQSITLTLTVTDGGGLTATADVVVTVRAATLTAPVAPAAPTVSASGQTGLSVTWAAPADGGSPITSYDLRYRTGTGQWTVIDSAWTSGDLTHTVTGLAAGTTYEIQVRAVNTVGDGAWSDSATSSTDAATVPIRATWPSAAADGQTALSVSWTIPSSDGGSPITSYDLQWRRTGTTIWTVVDNAWTSGGLSYTVTGLAAGTTYEIQVRAVNSVGDGPWSLATSQTTAANQRPTATATGIPTTVDGGGTVTLTGTARDPGDTLTYTWSSNGGGSFANASALSTTWTAPAATTSQQSITLTLTVTDGGGLEARATVAVTVRATAPTPEAPAAPAAPTLTVGGESAITASWSEPDTGGSPITDYDVRWRESGSSSAWTEAPDSTPSAVRSYAITGLAAATAYEVQVRAGNSVGDGAWSASETATTEAAPVATAVQTISLGSQPFADGGNAEWAGAVLLDARLVDGGGTAYLRYIRRVANHIQIRLSASATGEPSDAGPDFADAKETAAALLTFSYGDGENESITLRGPGSSDNTYADSSDPYYWTPDNGADWSSWMNRAASDGGEVTLTIALE